MAQVDAQSSDQLFRTVDQAIGQKYDRIHLLLSSPGGSVFHGLSIYNFLRGAPIEVHTHNFGSVDSIGVIIFCAGAERLSVPHARFLLHGVKFNINGSGSFDEKQMEEFIKGLRIDQQNIARVISDTTGRPIETVEADMNNRITLNPSEGKEYGLVHEIRSELFMRDAQLVSIGESANGSQRLVMPPGMQPGMPYSVQMPF